MRYFVTGATGFIGGRLARRLRQDGHEVVALVRNPDRAAELARFGVQLAPGDILDAGGLRVSMQGADGVFHVAAWYKVGARDKSMAERVNVGGTRNVLEVARETGVAKIVYTSTIAVFGDTGGRLVDETYRKGGPWLTEYDRTKWLAHYEVAEPMMREGLPLVIVQPGVVYGPGDQSLVRDSLVRYLKRRLPAAPRKTTYCLTQVDDVVEGHILAMQKGHAGQSYVIAADPRTFVEVFALAERLTGIPAPRLHPGPRMMRCMASLSRILGRVVRVPDAYVAESLRVMAGVTYIASHGKARRELGFEPRPLEAGLGDTLAYEMKQLGLVLPGSTAS